MIGIVGGGISGLAVARQLAAAGTGCIVLEAADRSGGVIRSLEVEARVLELGPQRTRLTPPFADLVDDLGLRDRLITARDLPLFVYVDGRLRRVPMSPGAALTTDLIGWRDRGRALLEPLTGGLRDGETAAEFFRRKFGRRIYERLIAPLYGGLYASDPADMPARHALAATLEALGDPRSLLLAGLRGSRARAAVPACSFDAGLQVMTDTLAAWLGERVRLRSPVRSIRRAGEGFRLVTDDDEVGVERVVLACPAGAAATALRELAPDAAGRLARLRYNPLALVHLLSDADLDGLGYQVALEEGRVTRGVTWNHAMFGRDGLYTAFLGGAAQPVLPARPNAELSTLAEVEFRELTGFEARAIHVHRTAMPAWDRTWDALDGLDLPSGVVVCANWQARPGLTGRLLQAAGVARALAAG